MRQMNELDITLLRRIVQYVPHTGDLYWKPRTPDLFRGNSRCCAEGQCAQWNGQNAGHSALGSITTSGYLKGAIFGRTFLAHRVAWAAYHGNWPTQVDHINGVRTDNRIINLRQASDIENQRNRRLPSINKSGRIGVFWHEVDSCWRAFIGVRGRRIHLGSFKEKDAAIAARISAEREHGFHPNHGRRA